MNQLIVFLLGIPAIMIATTIHEFTRAAVSSSLGDKLPREQGRLTINPLKHFEPIGMILMLACGFGWGLPVNTSALYYKDRKKGVLITAVAPTIANLIFAFVFAFAGWFTSNIYFLSILFVKTAYYKLIQYEKVIQMGFLFLLFLGLGNFFGRIIDMLYMAITSIFF